MIDYVNTRRIEHIYRDPHKANVALKLHYGDIAASARRAASANRLIGATSTFVPRSGADEERERGEEESRSSRHGRRREHQSDDGP